MGSKRLLCVSPANRKLRRHAVRRLAFPQGFGFAELGSAAGSRALTYWRM